MSFKIKAAAVTVATSLAAVPLALSGTGSRRTADSSAATLVLGGLALFGARRRRSV